MHRRCFPPSKIRAPGHKRSIQRAKSYVIAVIGIGPLACLVHSENDSHVGICSRKLQVRHKNVVLPTLRSGQQLGASFQRVVGDFSVCDGPLAAQRHPLMAGLQVVVERWNLAASVVPIEPERQRCRRQHAGGYTILRQTHACIPWASFPHSPLPRSKRQTHPQLESHVGHLTHLYCGHLSYCYFVYQTRTFGFAGFVESLLFPNGILTTIRPADVTGGIPCAMALPSQVACGQKEVTKPRCLLPFSPSSYTLRFRRSSAPSSQD